MQKQPLARDDAASILHLEVEGVREGLRPVGIRVGSDTATNAGVYLSCCYNTSDLDDINIVVFERPLLNEHDSYDRDGFIARVRAGLKEETIHAVQVMAVRDEFRRLDDLEVQRYRDGADFYEKVQTKIFEELAGTEKGRETLLSAGRLYYADPKIETVEDLRAADKAQHGREGYVAVELVRQVVQLRQDDLLAEETRAEKHGWYETETTRQVFAGMVGIMRQVAQNPGGVCETLRVAVSDVEDVYADLEKVQAGLKHQMTLPLSAPTPYHGESRDQLRESMHR